MNTESKRLAWREHTCRTCIKSFRASRIDAAFCSGRCRTYWCKHGAPYPSVLRTTAKIDDKLYPINLTTLPELPRDNDTGVTVPVIAGTVTVIRNSKMDEVDRLSEIKKKELLDIPDVKDISNSNPSKEVEHVQQKLEKKMIAKKKTKPGTKPKKHTVKPITKKMVVKEKPKTKGQVKRVVKINGKR